MRGGGGRFAAAAVLFATTRHFSNPFSSRFSSRAINFPSAFVDTVGSETGRENIYYYLRIRIFRCRFTAPHPLYYTVPRGVPVYALQPSAVLTN
jgi:hypothetical protein